MKIYLISLNNIKQIVLHLWMFQSLYRLYVCIDLYALASDYYR